MNGLIWVLLLYIAHCNSFYMLFSVIIVILN
jgi:hypothetical protein